LIARDLVVESEGVSSVAGRKPIPLLVRGDCGYLVGVDIGSFYTRIVITDINGKIIHKHQFETCLHEGRVHVLRRVFQCIHRELEAAKVAAGAMLGMGIAHSGVIDTENGVVLSFPRPGQMSEWKNVPLREIFAKEFEVPCVLEDSARAGATAERCFGSGRDVDDFLYIEVGVGIGAAFFFDGKLYRGAGGKAGEFGHITVDENGRRCSCGNNGCLESVASCAAIIEAVKVAMERGVDSAIRDLVGGSFQKISIEIIAQAAAENDSFAFRILQDAASNIAIGLADLVNLLNPRLIIFDGALFRAAPQLISDPLKRVIKQRSLEKSALDANLKVSLLGGEAGALGASRMIAGKVLKRLYMREQ
jgi:predicted NBD/HSP70 family sugar kinase